MHRAGLRLVTFFNSIIDFFFFSHLSLHRVSSFLYMYVINSGKFSESSDFKKLFVLPHYSQIALSKFPLKA